MEKRGALECHFTWINKELLEDYDVPALMDCLETDILMGDLDLQMLARVFMAFLCTQGCKPELERALDEIMQTVALCHKLSRESGCDRHQGYELVALSNKAHILQDIGDEKGVVETLKQVEILARKKSGNDKVKASILGMHGYASSHVGNYVESLKLFREAEELDPENSEWPLERGFVAGCLHKREKQINSKSIILKDLDQEQEESLERAVELTDGKHYAPLLHLAEIYYRRGRGSYQFCETRDGDLLNKAKTLYMRVYDMRPYSPAVLKRIGIAFPEIDEVLEPFAEECLLKAQKIEPHNSVLLHKLGQFYEYCHGTKRDFRKAEKYYMEAVTSELSRNLSAEMDLGRVRRKLDKGYDLEKHLKDLLAIYPGEEHQLIILDILEQLNTASVNRYMARWLRNLRL